MEYLNDALKYLRDVFIDSLLNNLDKQGQFDIYKFLIFFILIFVIFVGIYIPYL